MIKWMAGTPAYKTNIDPIYQTKEQVRLYLHNISSCVMQKLNK